MNISMDTLYQQARRQLEARYGASEASALAFALLEDLYGASRTDVLRGKGKEISSDEPQIFAEILQKMASGVPMQYATGRALFCGRYFHVTPDVLIPRPETEFLAELPLPASHTSYVLPLSSHTRPLSGPTSGLATTYLRAPRILDCGTGSGCIAVSLALLHPTAEVEAWDISPAALSVAEGNAEELGAHRVAFVNRDILAEALCEPSRGELPFDMIVSNPPYVCDREAADMEEHVLSHEPHLALFVSDNDPLRFYSALAALAIRRLAPGGCLAVECNTAYVEATADLFRTAGLQRVTSHDDCFGLPRFVIAYR